MGATEKLFKKNATINIKSFEYKRYADSTAVDRYIQLENEKNTSICIK